MKADFTRIFIFSLLVILGSKSHGSDSAIWALIVPTLNENGQVSYSWGPEVIIPNSFTGGYRLQELFRSGFERYQKHQHLSLSETPEKFRSDLIYRCFINIKVDSPSEASPIVSIDLKNMHIPSDVAVTKDQLITATIASIQMIIGHSNYKRDNLTGITVRITGTTDDMLLKKSGTYLPINRTPNSNP